MPIERFVLIAIAVLSASTIFYIPKTDYRKAFLSALIFQATTWFVSLMLVQTDMVDYHAREFAKASRAVFTPQFTLYPTLFMWFILLFPHNKKIIFKVYHCALFISLNSWFAYFAGMYTDISEFTKGHNHIYITYCLFTAQYLLGYTYIHWFFKVDKSKERRKNVPD